MSDSGSDYEDADFVKPDLMAFTSPNKTKRSDFVSQISKMSVSSSGDDEDSPSGSLDLDGPMRSKKPKFSLTLTGNTLNLSFTGGRRGMRAPKFAALGLDLTEDDSHSYSSSTHAPKRPGMKIHTSYDLASSFQVSETTFVGKNGIKITKDGITQLPDGQNPTPVKRPDGSPPTSGSAMSVHPRDLIQLGTLGSGVSSTVTKAFHVSTLSLVALKNIGVFDKSRRDQLAKELGLFCTISCPQIVDYYGAFFDQGKIIIVLEFMNRGSLQNVVDTQGSLSETILKRVAKNSMAGLLHLHANYEVHRDIKPSNLLMNDDGDIKIADFGIVADLDNTQDQCNTVIGTSAYMSPERILAQSYGYSSDIWSVGLSLVTCALGRYPFDTTSGLVGLCQQITQGGQIPDIDSAKYSASCRDFIAKCLIQDPAKRWTARQLLAHDWIQGNFDDGDQYEQSFSELTATSHDFGVQAAKKQSKKQAGPSAGVLEQLERVLWAVHERFYVQANEQYRKSLFDMARFDKIAQQFNVSVQCVKKTFEAIHFQSDRDRLYS